MTSGGINFNDYPENQLTKFCAVYTVNAIYANRDKKILATLMAFNDFSMVLTVVVFCIFFSVLHYKVTAFNVSAIINLCYLILNIILLKNTTGTKEHCQSSVAMPLRSGLMFGGVWSHKWEGVGVLGGCRNITALWAPKCLAPPSRPRLQTATYVAIVSPCSPLQRPDASSRRIGIVTL